MPENERRGRVFRPLCPVEDGIISRVDTASKVICAIGEAARVVVHKTEGGKVKYASAHDCRRSFGFRWSRRIMPPELMELMRHESVQTSMQFYVGRNAESTADRLWEAYRQESGGNTVANSEVSPTFEDSPRNDESPCDVRASEVHPTGLEPVTFGSVDLGCLEYASTLLPEVAFQ